VEVATGRENVREFSLILAKDMPIERAYQSLMPNAQPDIEVQGRNISWTIPQSVGRGRVSIAVVGINGRISRSLVESEVQDPGVYNMELPDDLPRGAGYRIVLFLNGTKASKALNLHMH